MKRKFLNLIGGTIIASLMFTSIVSADNNAKEIYVDPESIVFEQDVKDGNAQLLIEDEFKFENPLSRVSGSYGIYKWSLYKYNGSLGKISAHMESSQFIETMKIEHHCYYSGGSSEDEYKENSKDSIVAALTTTVSAKTGYKFASTYAYYTFRDSSCGNKSPSLKIDPLT